MIQTTSDEQLMDNLTSAAIERGRDELAEFPLRAEIGSMMPDVLFVMAYAYGFTEGALTTIAAGREVDEQAEQAAAKDRVWPNLVGRMTAGGRDTAEVA